MTQTCHSNNRYGCRELGQFASSRYESSLPRFLQFRCLIWCSSKYPLLLCPLIIPTHDPEINHPSSIATFPRSGPQPLTPLRKDAIMTMTTERKGVAEGRLLRPTSRPRELSILRRHLLLVVRSFCSLPEPFLSSRSRFPEARYITTA